MVFNIKKLAFIFSLALTSTRAFNQDDFSTDWQIDNLFYSPSDLSLKPADIDMDPQTSSETNFDLKSESTDDNPLIIWAEMYKVLDELETEFELDH